MDTRAIREAACKYREKNSSVTSPHQAKKHAQTLYTDPKLVDQFVREWFDAGTAVAESEATVDRAWNEKKYG